ncbi:hypothetical protein [Hymenobacter cheonanensis]|uniref:hypothetical protein n=1 Tax=Hymenobacter sp. CA2-7 TaxID=3063993 RepID=UPI002713F72C|nr:hypothetical protein [Hymenobacter sp. CA2-7]MDO7884245.1 hypothetical protein [Hymenobacter sp. CA2-7]
MPRLLRHFVHALLDYHDGGQTRAECILDGALLTLISLNAAAVVLDTVKTFDQ